MGSAVALRSHPARRLVIVLRGSARLIGRTTRYVQQGDAVTLPPNHEYGFDEVGIGGLHALHVAFGDAASATTSEVMSLDALLARNDARAKIVVDGPFFGVLRSGALRSARKRNLFLNCIRAFSDAFQTILFTRQAMCREGAFAESFHAHFLEELGHNTSLDVPRDERVFADPILRATSSWFCHQMLVLDNLAKTVLVNLVLETAGYHFHTRAKAALGGDVFPAYFDAHSEEAEQGHKDGGLAHLAGQLPDTYRRLHRVLEDGWDMFESMALHIAHLVETEGTSS